MSEENQEFKEYLLSELKELGYRENAEELSLEGLKLAIKFQKEKNELITNSKQEPPEGKPKPKIGPVDLSRDNALAMATDIGRYIDLLQNPIDPRSIDNELYKRDNRVLKFSKDQDSLECWIVRGPDGRVC